jgi:hypothetical protein
MNLPKDNEALSLFAQLDNAVNCEHAYCVLAADWNQKCTQKVPWPAAVLLNTTVSFLQTFPSYCSSNVIKVQ